MVPRKSTAKSKKHPRSTSQASTQISQSLAPISLSQDHSKPSLRFDKKVETRGRREKSMDYLLNTIEVGNKKD